MAHEIEFLECNPKRIHIRLLYDREETVSVHQLTPKGQPNPIPSNETTFAISEHPSPSSGMQHLAEGIGNANDLTTKTLWHPPFSYPLGPSI